MRCTSPRTVGFLPDGKTICWSPKHYSKEFAIFQLPCGKCIECRLDYARQWAIRCVHESQMYENNCFITLTYSEENLQSPKLIYSDFQKFMKKLRKLQKDPIGVFVTGEYGDKQKRPHWHACLFNWSPKDATYKYSNDRGDKIYESETLTKTWGKGIAEFGAVTFHSAGYCARYAAKKLIHGKDHEHDFQPISKKSSKHAIGKRWLEKFWPDVFNYGQIVLPDGQTCSIPRYYEKWFKQHKPKEWNHYVTRTKQEKMDKAALREQTQLHDYTRSMHERGFKGAPVTRTKARKEIQKQKFKMLQEKLKL